MRLIFDIETNGLLAQMDRIHCLCIRDADTGETFRHNMQKSGVPVEEGLKLLLKADKIIGHNVIGFDIPAIQKIYPWFKPEPAKVLDTLVYARLVYPDLIDTDMKLLKKETLPRKLFKSQGLEAWGYRLKKNKGDYSKEMKEKGLDPWAEWNVPMEDYCVLDTEVTQALLDKLDSKGFSQESIDLEMAVANIIHRQMRYGFLFDVEKAAKLYSMLVGKKLAVEQELKRVFTPMYLRDGAVFEPKRDNKAAGYVAGAPFQKLKMMEFNPGSRDHIAIWLKRRYKWKPVDFTEDGKPKIDETVLSQMTFPEAKLLKEYLTLDKRIGQIAEGKEAWMRKEKGGRIYGSVITNGACTGRMTHSSPNLAQVPAGYSPYGHECRELFCVPKGKVLVGADAAALELRDLAGYMARFDNGSYVLTVLEGDKKLGTDIHSVNARAIGLDPKGTYFDGESGRDIAKTWFYAFIYGAGDDKLGFILCRDKTRAKNLGIKSRAKFMEALPALARLVDRVKKAVKERGHLKGLDGRLLEVRHSHASLNTLLQSCGAIQMKKALVILDQSLQALGYIPGINYEFVANVHDEWQIEADEALGEIVGQKAVEAIRLAGEHFNFKCPLDGEYRVGPNWSATH